MRSVGFGVVEEREGGETMLFLKLFNGLGGLLLIRMLKLC